MKVHDPIKHLAIIMDGNARWTKNKMAQNSSEDKNSDYVFTIHRKGAEVARSIIFRTLELQIPYLTLFTFSSENWQRSKIEIANIMDLLNYAITAYSENLYNEGIKLQIIGRLDNIPAELLRNIENIVKLTATNNKMTLYIAFSYGGRNEIIDACQKIIDQKITQVDFNIFQQNLYDPLMPDVDLLIRTGGDQRISNFLLWQLAYTELYFTSKLWPDFQIDDLDFALKNYSSRKRNFGQRRV